MSPQPDGTNTGEMKESEVDENIAGSFPASDPPAWTLGTDHTDHKRDRGAGDEESDS